MTEHEFRTGAKPSDTAIETPAVTDDGIVHGAIFRVKPGIVNAIRFKGVENGASVFHMADGLPEWLVDAMGGPENSPGSIWLPHPPEPDIASVAPNALIVGTFAGDHAAMPGDWLIRFPDGHIATMDDASFHENYEQATELDADKPQGSLAREAFDEGYAQGHEAGYALARPLDPNKLYVGSRYPGDTGDNPKGYEASNMLSGGAMRIVEADRPD